ncbi:MAG: uroporphyrinogen-III synthase [Rhodospirillales bacterium]
MVKIIITRPELDAAETARRVTELGHEAVIAPLMTVHITPGPPLDLAGVQALLLTSANGARALAGRMGRRIPDLSVLCVGDATARAAQAAGLANVESAGGDVDDLARLAAARLRPEEGDLLHVAGTKVAGDLAGVLGADGFGYRREVLYEARAAENLPEAAHGAIIRCGAGDAACAVMLYSPRTAALFRELAGAAGLGDALGRATALCLSANVAARAGRPWGAVRVAPEPTEDSLFDTLTDLMI